MVAYTVFAALLELALLPAPHQLRFGTPALTRCSTHMCSAPRPIAELRVKELKEELDSLGVEWRGVCFDKETLAAALEAARKAPSSDGSAAKPTEAATATADPTEAATTDADSAESGPLFDAAYAAAYADCMALRVKELRTQLAARSVGWADLFEKEELAARLAELKVCARVHPRCPPATMTQSCTRPLAGTRRPLQPQWRADSWRGGPRQRRPAADGDGRLAHASADRRVRNVVRAMQDDCADAQQSGRRRW